MSPTSSRNNVPPSAFCSFPGFVLARAREATFAMPEQLAFDQLFRNRRAVHFDERLIDAGTVLMNRVRNQLFAGTAFSENQDPAVRSRHQTKLLAQRFHRNALADDAQLAVAFFQPLDLALQLALLAGILYENG